MEEVSLVKKKFIDYVDQIINNKKLSHAYLIEVGNYEEDFAFIMNFVKMILSNLTYFEVSSSGNSMFLQIDQFDYPDVKIIEPEGLWIKKSQMIDLQKDYSNKSLLNNKRVYIIKNAEKFNSSSANTMLKFLEEPEDDIIAILLCDNRYHVIDTLLSRCQILSIKDDNLLTTLDASFIDFFNSVMYPDQFFLKYFFFINELIPDKVKVKELLLNVENILIYYINNNSYIYYDIEKILKKITFEKLLSKISIIEDYLPKLDYNINYKLWLDSFFSQLILGG